MNTRLLLLAPLLLVGCGEREPGPETAVPVATEVLPASVTGRWAPEPELCNAMTWRVTGDAIISAGGVACALDSLRPSSRGWTAVATCADRAEGVIELSPSAGEPATLVVSGAPFAAPVTLVRCPAPGGAPPVRDPHAPLEAAAQTDLGIVTGAEGIVERRDPENAVVRAVWWRGGKLIKIVEPTVARDEGPRRTYYFREGEQTPFLVRTPTAAFAYEDGRLMNVFTPEGEILGELARQRFAEESRSALDNAEIARSLAATLQPDAASQTPTSG